jgi:anti-sigma-K factor RskA
LLSKGIRLKHECITKEGQELAALYALGALSQHEARAFDVHLREGCPACDFELKQFDEVAALLGVAVEPVAPSAYVRDLLAMRIQREEPEALAPTASVIPFPEQPIISQTPAKASSSVARSWLPWAVAAAFLLAFVFSFAAWRTSRSALQAEVDQIRDSSSAVLTENAELKEQLRKESAASGELAQINSVLSAPSARVLQLEGQDSAPGSSATIYWDVQGNRWVVTADLPPAPEGKVYQLWFVTAQAKISAGLIRPDRDGHGFIALLFPPDIGPLAAAAITLEPDGGSEQPTSAIYVMGNA